jgi:hypothetical protein
MIRKITRYLNRPAATNPNRTATVASAAGIVFFVLFCFAPFGLHAVSLGRRLLLAGGFAAVTAAAVASAFVLPTVFKTFYAAGKYTARRNMLHYAATLAIVAIGNYAFSILIFGLPPSAWLRYLLACIIMTVAVGVVPMLVIHFVIQSGSLERHLNEARQMNQLLRQRLDNPQSAAAAMQITLGANTREPMRILPADIIYIEASGNYVEVNYVKNGEARRKLLRATLAATMASISDGGGASIIRCHRAFAVNADHICSVEGNSQGLRIRLLPVRREVPASRSYIKEVKEKLNARHQNA